MKELRDNADPDIVIMLVGNKMDLQHLRAISSSDSVDFAKRNKLTFIETSALDSSHVEEAFKSLLSDIFHSMNKRSVNLSKQGTVGNGPVISGQTLIVDNPHKNTTTKCCNT